MALKDLDDKYGQGAAPRGLAQQGSAASGLQGLAETYGGSGRMPAWQTGGQYGQGSGFSTDFYDRMMKQRDEAEKNNALGDLQKSDKYTGVVTYDVGSGRNYGDVFDDGKKTGNVFTDYGDEQAYQLMAGLTLSADEQAQSFKDVRNNPNAVKEAVTARRAEDTKMAGTGASQRLFNEKVEDQKEDWDDGATAATTTAAAAAGGAGVGAGIGGTIGALFGGVGALPGALVGGAIGGVVGGIGGFLNRDAIEDQAARAAVQTEMAGDEFGAPGALSTGLRQWGAASMSAINPLTNLVQGVTDANSEGGIGDGSVAYYEMENRPAWLTGLGMAATLGDSLLQFASPIGRGAFMTAMTTTTAGGVGQLATQGGATFDDRAGEFHRPEDFGQAAAAVGAIGIDAIQLFGARGITRAAQNQNRVAGEVVDPDATGFFNPRTAAQQSGQRAQEIGGRTFFLDDAGKVTGVRSNLTVIAPSEAVMWASARAKALRMQAKTEGAVTPENFDELLYRAARDISEGANLAQTTLLTAFGEGLEEGTQSILEPLSHGWTPRFEDVAESYFQGMMAGAGMSLGANVGRVGRSDRQFAQANILNTVQGQPLIDKAAWQKMSVVDRERATLPGAPITKALEKSAEKIAESYKYDVVNSVAGMEKILDARTKAAVAQAPNIEGSYKIAGLQSADAKNYWVQSGVGTIEELLLNKLDLYRLRADASDPVTDPEPTALRDALDEIMQAAGPLFTRAKSPNASIALPAIQELNELFEQAWASTTPEQLQGGQFSPHARAISIVLARNPNNNEASYILTAPNILPGVDDGLLQTPRVGWKGSGADADGDEFQNRVYIGVDLDQTAYRSMRIGLTYTSTEDMTPTLGQRASEVDIIAAVGIETLVGGAASKNATALVEDLGTWARATFAAIPGVDTIVDSFQSDLLAGLPSARDSFLQRLLQSGDMFFQISEQGVGEYPAGTNFLFEVERQLNMGLQRYRDATAARMTDEVNLTDATPLPQNTVYADFHAQPAATPQITLDQEYVGTDPMRKKQKPYYSLFRTSEWTAGQRPQNESDMWAEYFAAINSKMAQSARAEALAGKNDIARRAIRMIEKMVEENNLDIKRPVGAIAIMAGLQMPNYQQDANGTWNYQGELTVAQYALQESLRYHRAINETALAADPELQQKYSTIERFSQGAGNAIAYMFDAMPMEALVGEGSHTFGRHQTLGQVRATYLAMDDTSRKRQREALNSDARAKAGNRHDLPYRWDEFEREEVNEYKVIIDALFESVSSELTHDPLTGKMTGTLVTRDQEISTELQKSFEHARKALSTIRLKGKGENKVQNLHRILNSNNDFARPFFNLLPDEAVAAILTTSEDGRQVSVPLWFSELLLMEDSKEAVMHYFRNVFIAQVNSYNAQQTPEDSDDRLIQLVLRLRNDSQIQYQRFLEILYTRNTVDEFLRDVNREFIDGPPQLAWHREAARFDPSLSEGGWTMKLPGSEWREALSKFSQASIRFGRYAQAEKIAFEADEKYLGMLQHALDQQAVNRDADTQDLLDKLARRLSLSGELLPALGPAALLRAGFSVSWGFMANATDKGKVQVGTEQLGDDALRGDGPSQDLGYEQILGSLTAFDADDVSRNPQVLAKGDLRMVDSEGRSLNWEWSEDSETRVKQFLDLAKDPGNRTALRSIIYPSVYEWQQSGTLRQELLSGITLQDYVSSNVYLKTLTENSGEARLRYAGQVNALVREFGGNNDLLAWATDLANARIHASARTLEAFEVEEIVAEAMYQVVDVLRAYGEIANSEESVKMIRDAMKELRSKVPVGQASSTAADILRKSLSAFLEPELPENATDEEITFAEAQTSAITSYVEGEDFEQVIRAFAINWKDDSDVSAKQKMMFDLVQKNPAYATASGGPVLKVLASTTAMDVTGELPILSADPAINQELWDAVSLELLGVMRDQVTSEALTRVKSSTPPKEILEAIRAEGSAILDRTLLGNARYWDANYDYLLDRLIDPNSTLAKAAKKYHQVAHGTENSTELMVEGDLFSALKRVIDPSRLGPWTSDLASRSVHAQTRLDASGARRQIGRSGSWYEKDSSISRATQRTYADPAAVAKPRVYSIGYAELDDFISEPETVDPFEKGWLATTGDYPDESLILLNGRFISGARVSYSDRTSATTVTVDLLNDPSVLIRPGHAFQGDAEGRALPYFSTSMDQLRASLANLNLPWDARLELDLWHPEDQPADPAFANNLYFEGTGLPGAGDHFKSIHDTLTASNEGLAVEEGNAALKVWKKGGTSISNPVLPTLEEIQDMENPLAMYEMLRAKTEFLLQRDLGNGATNPARFSAVFHEMKMRHGVRTIVEGQARYYSAEQVIALQREGQQPEGEQLELVTLSARQLRALFGDSGNYTLSMVPPITPTLDSSGIAPWNGNLQSLAEIHVPAMLDIDANTGSYAQGSFEDTRFVQRGSIERSSMKAPLTRDERLLHQRTLEAQYAARDLIFQNRINHEDRYSKNFQQAMKYVRDDSELLRKMPNMALRDMGINVPLPVGVNPLEESGMAGLVFSALRQAFQETPLSSGWIVSYDTSGTGGRATGILRGFKALSDEPRNKDGHDEGGRIARGDLAVVRLETFPTDPETRVSELTRYLKKLTGYGTTIALTDGNGDRSTKNEIADELTAMGYERIPGAVAIWQPRDMTARRSQTWEARMSRFTETRKLSAQNNVVVFHSRQIGVDENYALVNNINRKTNRQVLLQRELAPVTAWNTFGIATGDDRGRVKAQLEKLNASPALQRHLYELSKTSEFYSSKTNFSKKQDAEEFRKFQVALDRATQNYDLNTGRPEVGTEFGPGDFLVLIGKKGQLLLSRHGYEPLKDKYALQDQLATPIPADVRHAMSEEFSNTPGGIAIYGPTPLPKATTHNGTIHSWEETEGFGLNLVQRVPIQALGDKTVLERNGMKLIGISRENSGVELPEFGPLKKWEVDYLINWADSVSKENFDGLIDNAQNAIAYFGMDFTQPLVRTFFDESMTEEKWLTLKDSERASLRRQAHDFLHSVTQGERLSVPSVLELQKGLSSNSADLRTALTFALSSEEALSYTNVDVTALIAKDPNTRTVEELIALNQVLTMHVRGMRPEHVLSAAGFDSVPSLATDASSVLMPELFTRTFDRAPQGSDLRNWFFTRLNRRVHNEMSQDAVQDGYMFREDWTFVIKNKNPEKNMEGYLQFAEGVSSGDNPTLARDARARADSGPVSTQYSKVAEQALGVRPFHVKLPKGENENITRIESARDIFSIMSGENIAEPFVPRTGPFMTRRQMQHLRDSQEQRKKFQIPLDTRDWTREQVEHYESLRNDLVARHFGWSSESPNALMVDHWVRIFNAAPKERDPKSIGEQGLVGPNRAEQALAIIERNLNAGLFPTSGDLVASPLPAVSLSEVQQFWDAAQSGRGTWALAEGSSLEDYQVSAIGMMRKGGDAAFDMALDGYFNTFRYAGENFYPADMVTLSDFRRLELLAPDDEIAVSLDPARQYEFERPSVAEIYEANLVDLREGQREMPTEAPGTGKLRRWRNREDIPHTVGNLRYGRNFLSQGAFTTAAVRTLLNVRGALVMLNPILHVASIGEFFVRNTLEGATSLLTGASLTKAGEVIAARTGGDVETIQRAREIIKTLANDRRFRSMINREITVHQKLDNAGPVERFTRKMMELGGKMQDGMYGIPAREIAQRYVEGVLQARAEEGGATMIDARTLLEQLARDPEAMRHQGAASAEWHQQGLNAVERTRTLRATTWSTAFRAIVDPMANSVHTGRNLVGNLVLKLPLMFLPFAASLTTNALGLQGLNALSALALQGNQGGKRLGKFQAHIQGVDYNPEVHGVDWLADATDGVNFANAFIRSGLTHTSLIGLGLLSGSLGLSGEDEEDRRRRRAEQAQGAPHVYDPRRIENDFRNAGAIYFDNLPDWVPFRDFLSEHFEVTGEDAVGGKTSMAQLHWTMKMYMSPIMGIEKFLDTGNFNHVVWGFEDGIGSMPLVNAATWDDSTRVGTELYNAALDAEASGSPEKLGESFGFIMNIFSNYERMLLESSFVNGIYVANDTYDRDPWTLADLGIDGEILRDGTGAPMKTDTLNSFINQDGNIQQGRVTPDWFEGQLRTLGENRATLGAISLFGSLFTGSQDSMWRYDQAIRERKIDLPEMSTSDASALVLSMWDEENKREVLTREGGEAVLRGLRMGTVRPDDPALQNVYLSFEQRVELQEVLMSEIMQEYLDLGLSHDVATKQLNETWYGSSSNPFATPLSDVVWSQGKFADSISYSPTAVYRQLNTTYIMGPDGKPWATGIGRDKLNNFWGMSPLLRYNSADVSNLSTDDRLNSVDEMAGVNTGLRNLERVDPSWSNPKPEDIIKAMEDGFKDVTDAIREASNSNGNRYGGGSRGGYSRGGGGGGGGGGYAYRLNSPERNNSVYSANDPYVRPDDPILRRATIRRERYTSQRGRLNQWQ